MATTRKIVLERIEVESPEAAALLEVLESQRTDAPKDAETALRQRFSASGTKMD
jgi:hypothetical protein